MSHDGITILEWTYEPADLFEEPLDVAVLNGNVRINRGLARGEFPESEYDRGVEFRDAAHEKLEAHFFGQQLVTGKSIRLNAAAMTREYPDGRRDANVILGSASFTLTGSLRVDFTIRDQNGKFVSDSRLERHENQANFRQKVAAVLPNSEIEAMAKSFQKSFDDEENSFVHLYEVLDRLQTIFGSVGNAKSVLGQDDWNLVSWPSNDPRNAQGRHRGKTTEHERPSPNAVRESRDAVRRLITAYVKELASE